MPTRENETIKGSITKRSSRQVSPKRLLSGKIAPSWARTRGRVLVVARRTPREMKKREMKKHEEGVRYWKTRTESGENGTLSYWKVEDGRTEELVRTMLSFISKKNRFTAWEFGCNSGRNMLAIKKVYPRVKIEGNDINVPAVKFARRHGLDVAHRDTIALIQSMKPVDVTISMAHLMHLSKIHNETLKTQIARVTKSWLFCVEPTSDLDGSRVWRRSYPQFFKKDFRLIEEIPSCIPGGAYRIYVFKKNRAFLKTQFRNTKIQYERDGIEYNGPIWS